MRTAHALSNHFVNLHTRQEYRDYFSEYFGVRVQVAHARQYKHIL